MGNQVGWTCLKERVLVVPYSGEPEILLGVMERNDCFEQYCAQLWLNELVFIC